MLENDVLSPIAASALTIKNLLMLLECDTTAEGMVKILATIDIATKPKINQGKRFIILTFLSVTLMFSFLFNLKLINVKTNTVGIMQRVLVSFTVTALSKVAVPNPHILSHVEAAAVTEDVSFTAVPANIPNASPEVVENPSIVPNGGNKIAANTLKKKITEIACATSSSSASITGAVAAIADPPHIEEPTPTISEETNETEL